MVSIDVDGTLTTVHGWRFIAERLGRTAEFERTNAAFFAHREDEDEHLRHLLGAATGLPLSRLVPLLEATPKLTGISEAVRELVSLGLRPVLLTHNPHYIGRWYAERFGFVDWDGTSAGPDPEVDGGVIRPPGAIRADKIGGLARLMGRAGIRDPREVAHAGDGWADATIFPRVGFGIAVNSELPEVDRAADAVLRITDLRPLVGTLRSATPRPLRQV